MFLSESGSANCESTLLSGNPAAHTWDVQAQVRVCRKSISQSKEAQDGALDKDLGSWKRKVSFPKTEAQHPVPFKVPTAVRVSDSSPAHG